MQRSQFVLGCVRRSKALLIDERYLGLRSANEIPQFQTFINKAANMIAGQINLNALMNLNCIRLK